MKIINRTVWRTDHLKAILQKAAEIELEPAKRKAMVVTVMYTRGGLSSGCAYLGGRHATVRIRHPFSRTTRRIGGPLSPEMLTDLKLAFASVAAHELAHARGMTHEQMPKYYKWAGGSWREYVAWAANLPLDVKVSKVTAKPALDDKLAHVQRMLKVAETRVKRAQTIAKKWKQKERYYLRTMAARTAEPLPSTPQS